MSRQGFYDLSRQMIREAYDTLEGPDREAIVWNWSVICAIIEGARREVLSERRQQDIYDALEVDECPPWSAVFTAAASVAAAFRER